MKQGFDEGYFIKNNQKSSVHCLEYCFENAGKYSIYHFHNYIEVLYGVDCSLKIWIDDKLEEISSGDVCFILPKEIHAVYSDKSNNKYKVIKFSPEILEYIGQTTSEIGHLLPLFQKHNHFQHVIEKKDFHDPNIAVIFKEIFKNWNEQKIGYEFAIRGEILKLFSRILSVWEDKYSETTFSNASAENVNAIQKALPYITNNLVTVSARDVANYIHMSYSYFSRVFKQVIGKNFSQFVTESRINEAKRLLLTTSYSLTEIAQHIGFASLSHFIYAFRQETGTTPNLYRNKNNHILSKL